MTFSKILLAMYNVRQPILVVFAMQSNWRQTLYEGIVLQDCNIKD